MLPSLQWLGKTVASTFMKKMCLMIQRKTTRSKSFKYALIMGRIQEAKANRRISAPKLKLYNRCKNWWKTLISNKSIAMTMLKV